MIWGSFWVLWCFVAQHLGKHALFYSGFFLRNGVPFLWFRSGALCADVWRFSFFGLLVACAVVLGWLWARRVWSGRLGPRIMLVVFLGRLFSARNGHMDSAEMHKNTWFWSYLWAKGGSQQSFHASLSVPKAGVFSSVFANLAGTFWFKMTSLVPNWAFHSVFLMFCSVPFVSFFWVLLTGWSAGWPLCVLI